MDYPPKSFCAVRFDRERHHGNGYLTQFTGTEKELSPKSSDSGLSVIPHPSVRKFVGKETGRLFISFLSFYGSSRPPERCFFSRMAQ